LSAGPGSDGDACMHVASNKNDRQAVLVIHNRLFFLVFIKIDWYCNEIRMQSQIKE